MSDEIAEAAWIDYRDAFMRARPWCGPRAVSRQLRKRDFIAGFLAATIPPGSSRPDGDR